MGADAQQNRIVFALNVGNLNVLADGNIGMYLNTGAENDINIVLQHIFRQTIARNAVTQHAAQLRTLFVNNRLMTH